MIINVVSDLHLEWSSCTISNTQNADVLILAGDIMMAQILHDYSDTHKDSPIVNGRQELSCEFRKFLSNVSNEFKHIIYVAGNHELYQSKWYEGIDYLRDECEKYNNIHFLEQNSIKIDDVWFIGGTLWTNCNKKDDLTLMMLKTMMNDFKYIKNESRGYCSINPIDTVVRHQQTLHYFKTELDHLRTIDPTNKIVIVSHHAPTHLSIHEKYKHDTVMNGGYYSDLSEFILDYPEISVWVHGHTHTNFDYTIGTTRVICNPRGYENEKYKENFDWDSNMSVEI